MMEPIGMWFCHDVRVKWDDKEDKTKIHRIQSFSSGHLWLFFYESRLMGILDTEKNRLDILMFDNKGKASESDIIYQGLNEASDKLKKKVLKEEGDDVQIREIATAKEIQEEAFKQVSLSMANRVSKAFTKQR